METPAESAAVDTVVHDTTYVFVLERGDVPELPAPRGGQGAGLSWIIAAMLLLFMVIAIRARRNSKFIAGMLRDATDVRERGNVFDDTVRETTFMVVLNLMWCVCAGVMLYALLCVAPPLAGTACQGPDGDIAAWGSDVGGLAGGMAGGIAGASVAGIALCIGATAMYQMLMTGMYLLVGNVFSDSTHTRMWVRGLWSATGLSTALLFPAALIAVCYPAEVKTALWIALGVLILMKIIVIRKGFRIFFTEVSTWVIFLCYLCSLEIVPLILLYVGSAEMVGFWG